MAFFFGTPVSKPLRQFIASRDKRAAECAISSRLVATPELKNLSRSVARQYPHAESILEERAQT
jgi:hypothetical protein